MVGYSPNFSKKHVQIGDVTLSGTCALCSRLLVTWRSCSRWWRFRSPPSFWETRTSSGYFSDRLARMIWRYPSVTRPGVQIAWLTWAALVVICVDPVDPLHTVWDQYALIAAALIVVWRRVGEGLEPGVEIFERSL